MKGTPMTPQQSAREHALEEAAVLVLNKTQEPWKSEAIKREGIRIAYALRAWIRAEQKEGPQP